MPHDEQVMTSRVRVTASLLAGLVAGTVVSLVVPVAIAVLLGWDAAALTYISSAVLIGRRLDAKSTAAVALREDPGRATMDVILLGAAVASIGAVVAVIATAGPGSGVNPEAAVAMALGSLFLSWSLVHVLYAARYARLYYTPPVGGVDFNGDVPPSYNDFAYLAFTIGMTYQVSDTSLRAPVMRRTALFHALLSYLLGAVIIAATINLVAGLAR
jgi:uncharacterized membrane protein